MTDSWSAWLGQIDRVEDLDTIVHLGAGYGADVPAMVRTAARRIVLVEPNPAFQDALAGAATADSRIALRPLALAQTPGPAPFQVFNVAAHSSLRSPTGLYGFFPGLQLRDTPMVDTLTLAGLLKPLDLAPDRTHVLIVDVPGDTAMILQQLADMAENPFAHLLICAASEVLYETQPEMLDPPGALTGPGYAIADMHRDDPCFPTYWMRRDRAQIELDRLHATRQHEAEAHQDLQQRHDAQADQLAQAQAALKDLTAALEDLRARQPDTARLEDELAKARTAEAALTARVTELETADETLNGKLEDAAERIEQGRHDVAMALRMRALHDADMADLRQRHAALVAQKNELEALLRQVTARLMIASEHLHQTEPVPSGLIPERKA